MKYFSIEINGYEGALAPIENLDKARKDFIDFCNIPPANLDTKKQEQFLQMRENIINAKIRIYKVHETETVLNLIDKKELNGDD